MPILGRKSFSGHSHHSAKVSPSSEHDSSRRSGSRRSSSRQKQNGSARQQSNAAVEPAEPMGMLRIEPLSFRAGNGLGTELEHEGDVEASPRAAQDHVQAAHDTAAPAPWNQHKTVVQINDVEPAESVELAEADAKAAEGGSASVRASKTSSEAWAGPSSGEMRPRSVARPNLPSTAWSTTPLTTAGDGAPEGATFAPAAELPGGREGDENDENKGEGMGIVEHDDNSEEGVGASEVRVGTRVVLGGLVREFDGAAGVEVFNDGSYAVELDDGLGLLKVNIYKQRGDEASERPTS